MDSEKYYLARCLTAIQAGKITATEYRHGAVIDGWPSRWPIHSGHPKPKRGLIRSMSVRSQIRAAFQISNSPANFDLMTTLTFRVSHPEPKESLRQWCLSCLLNQPPDPAWGWAMEFQARGVVHYHVIHNLAQLTRDLPQLWVEWSEFKRKGQPRKVLQGSLGRRMQDWWIAAVGDSSSEFLRFQRGGITEMVARPELTGRYLGSYVAKAAQKTLPDCEPPQGRWWWLSEAARPTPGRVITLKVWPFDRIHRLIHDKNRLPEFGLEASTTDPI